MERTFTMAPSGNHAYAAEIVAESPGRAPLRPGRLADVPQRGAEISDPGEQRSRQRAHRLALLLMGCSSIVTLVTVYGAWTLLHRIL